MRQTILSIVTGAVILLACVPASAQDRPNVLILLADDFGYGDPSCHGGSIPTPHLDKLISQGRELDTFLTFPVCSPTRAALMTGRHPARVGVNPTVLNPRAGELMNPRETTLAEVFKRAGYKTGIVGKWHLGIGPTTPNLKGFDYFYGFIGAATEYLERPGDDDDAQRFMLNDKLSQDAGYATDLFRDRAVRFIGEHKADPFFLYVPFNAVHNPLEATPEYLARVPASVTETRARTRAAMVIAMDDAIGAILKKLDDDKLAERTIVVFFADNGPTPDGSAKPLRAGKHSVYDGGVRSPAVIRWPQKIKAGSRTTAMMAVEDLFPTLLKLTDTDIPKDLALDGKDMSAVVTSDAEVQSPREAQYWLWLDCDAIRTTKHKLIRYADRVELYDLEKDPNETTEVSKKHPNITARLLRRLDEWEASVPVYPSHIPLKIADLKPSASGDVLEIRAKRDEKAKPLPPLAIPLGKCEPFQLNNGDRLELDVLIPAGSSTEGLRVTYLNPGQGRRNARGRGQPLVEPGAPAPNGWTRRTMGMANHSPRKLDSVWLAFEGKQPGDFHIYVDNVVVRRADGSSVVLYQDGAAPPQKVSDIAGYSGVSLRAVPVAQGVSTQTP